LLNAAKKIEDLYFPPSNKFHSLEGVKSPCYAIWINNQWRISFEWHKDNNVYGVLQIQLLNYG
jgi:proteic killer suppression protein